jgi:hypothetical protein
MAEDAAVHTASLTAPRWILPLMTGLPAALVVVLFVGIVTPAPWPAAVVCGMLAVALVGSVTERWSRGRRALAASAAGNLSVDQQVVAFLAARSGPVPADPEVRAAALRIADHYLKRVPPKAVLLSAGPLPFAVIATVALSTAPGWVVAVLLLPALLAVICTAVLIWQAYYWPGRLRERIGLLSTP